jgi:hypothetical protein
VKSIVCNLNLCACNILWLQYLQNHNSIYHVRLRYPCELIMTPWHELKMFLVVSQVHAQGGFRVALSINWSRPPVETAPELNSDSQKHGTHFVFCTQLFCSFSSNGFTWNKPQADFLRPRSAHMDCSPVYWLFESV